MASEVFEEESAGGVIINRGRIALVRNLSGRFSLPKGHIRSGESPLEAAYREIEEETGIERKDLKLVKELGSYVRPDGFSGRRKRIHMFAFRCEKEDLKSKDPENSDPHWATASEAIEKLNWPQDRAFLLRHIKDLFSDAKI
ncbi:MAG: NUDIX domain-containing protein [Candidatus Woesearchaeota archaeon]